MDQKGQVARPAGSEATRAALIRAGLRLFGRQGFEATSTRAIAAAANANIGSIAYHFGGKEGLREACARHITETLGAVAGPTGVLDDAPPLSSAEAEQRLVQTVRRMVSFLLAAPQAGDFVQFVLRELSSPGGALETLYQGLFEPVHRRLCLLWQQAAGEPAESEHARLAVFSLIGQIVYFRIGREAVLRRMDWSGYGTEEAEKLSGMLVENLKAALAARRRVPS